MTSTTGRLFRVTTFGESHGPAVGVVIDGCPANIRIDKDLIDNELKRRRTGQSKLTSQRNEGDEVEVLSGVFSGRTTGAPLTLTVRNTDARPEAYDHLENLYRPSHADFTYDAKYGIRDHRGGGRASARETTARVIAGTIARQILTEHLGLEVLSWVSQVGNIDTTISPEQVSYDAVEASPVRCPDPEIAELMVAAIDRIRKEGDSLGGVVSATVRNAPPGLGEPVFDKLEADLAKALLSLPATKGFESGSGFAGTRLTGSQHNDTFKPSTQGYPDVATNNSGGIQGGISNGADINMRIAFKPTATIAKLQKTVTKTGETVDFEAKGRHDPCVLPRAVPIVEAAICLVLVDHFLVHRATQLD